MVYLSQASSPNIIVVLGVYRGEFTMKLVRNLFIYELQPKRMSLGY